MSSSLLELIFLRFRLCPRVTPIVFEASVLETYVSPTHFHILSPYVRRTPFLHGLPALVIEIVDGSVAESRRTVISKEERRALFDYFKHRPVRPHREERVASNAQETNEGVGSASVGAGEVESPAPSATPPICSCSAGAVAAAEGGGENGAEEPAVWCQVLDVGVDNVMVAPSSGAAAGISPVFSVVSG